MYEIRNDGTLVASCPDGIAAGFVFAALCQTYPSIEVEVYRQEKDGSWTFVMSRGS